MSTRNERDSAISIFLPRFLPMLSFRREPRIRKRTNVATPARNPPVAARTGAGRATMRSASVPAGCGSTGLTSETSARTGRASMCSGSDRAASLLPSAGEARGYEGWMPLPRQDADMDDRGANRFS
jgi:hypothetical protein